MYDLDLIERRYGHDYKKYAVDKLLSEERVASCHLLAFSEEAVAALLSTDQGSHDVHKYYEKAKETTYQDVL